MQLYITIRPAVTATDRGDLGTEVCEALRAELGLGAECTGGGTMFSDTFEGQFSDIDLEVDRTRPRWWKCAAASWRASR